MEFNSLQIWKTRPGHLVTEELGHVAAADGDNDSFASADDIGGLRVAFDDAIDNLTRFKNSKNCLVLDLCCSVSLAALPMTTIPTDQ